MKQTKEKAKETEHDRQDKTYSHRLNSWWFSTVFCVPIVKEEHFFVRDAAFFVKLPKVSGLVGGQRAGAPYLVVAHHIAQAQPRKNLDPAQARVRIGGFQRGGGRCQLDALVDRICGEFIEDAPGAVVQGNCVAVAGDLKAHDSHLLPRWLMCLLAVAVFWGQISVHWDFGAARQLVHFRGPQAIVQIEHDEGGEHLCHYCG